MGLELPQCKEEEHLVEDNLCIPVEEDTLFVESILAGEGILLAAAVEGNHLAAAVEDNHLAAAVVGNHLAAAVVGNHLAAAVEDNHFAAAVEGAAAVVGSHLVEDILLVESYIPALQCILDYCQSEDIKRSW